MTFKYNPAKHSLDEVARIENPETKSYGEDFYYMGYVVDLQEYNAHIASLRSIPCEKDTQWSDGELVEGKDFKVKEVGYPVYHQDIQYYTVAIPIKQEAAQEESIDMLKKIHYDLKHFEKHGMTEDFINNYLSKFTITKKR